MEMLELPKNKPLVWVGAALLILLFCCCCVIITLALVLPVISSNSSF